MATNLSYANHSFGSCHVYDGCVFCDLERRQPETLTAWTERMTGERAMWLNRYGGLRGYKA